MSARFGTTANSAEAPSTKSDSHGSLHWFFRYLAWMLEALALLPKKQKAAKKGRIPNGVRLMSASPSDGVPILAAVPDIFDRLLQCERLLTAKELAAILKLSPKTLYSYAERDLIPHFKIESNVRFCGKEVAGRLRQRSTFGGSPADVSARWDASIPSRPRSRSHRAAL